MATVNRTSGKKRQSHIHTEGLVPIRFQVDEELYALLDELAKRSGKTVSEVAIMYITVAVDKDAKIDENVSRAMQQLVAEDIARRVAPLLTLLRFWTKDKTLPN